MPFTSPESKRYAAERVINYIVREGIALRPEKALRDTVASMTFLEYESKGFRLGNRLRVELNAPVELDLIIDFNESGVDVRVDMGEAKLLSFEDLHLMRELFQSLSTLAYNIEDIAPPYEHPVIKKALGLIFDAKIPGLEKRYIEATATELRTERSDYEDFCWPFVSWNCAWRLPYDGEVNMTVTIEFAPLDPLVSNEGARPKVSVDVRMSSDLRDVYSRAADNRLHDLEATLTELSALTKAIKALSEV